MDSPGARSGTELRGLATRPDGSAWVVGASGSTSYANELCPEPPAATGIASVDPSLGSPGSLNGSQAESPEPTAVTDASPAVEPTPTPTPEQTSDAHPTTTPTPERTSDARPTPTPRPRSKPTPKSTPRPPVVARDMAVESGLARESASYGAIKADFDKDGWPDLFIGQHANAGRLVLNDGDGTFSAAPGVTIPRRDRHGCTVGDANGDKRPDLYCANGALRGAGFKANELYVQQADGTFREQAVSMRATDPFGRGRLSVFFDLDHDKYADLFLADRPARPDGLPSRHRVLANPTGDRYLARSVAGIDSGNGADCLRAADLDRDGWQDIVLCERAMDRPSSYGLRITSQ